jgi:hypothetical protein
MAVAAETVNWAEVQEEYAHSLSSIRRLGAFILEGETTEQQSIETLVRDDFYTGLGENLKTDREFRDMLDIDPWHNFAVKDGKVTAADGTTMVDMLERGLDASSRAAEIDPRMHNQVVRDRGDLKVARDVDALQPGELYVTVSMDPKDAMARDGVRYWETKGYRQGLAFLQFYYKHTDGGEVTAGAYSVDSSDQQLWRQVQARYGVTIPDGTSSDEHIQHALVRSMDSGDVLSFVDGMRQTYYQAAGDYRRRWSLTDYIERHSHMVDGYFEHYMRPLAEAIYSGKNNRAMQDFAAVILQTVDSLKPEAYSGLVRVCNSGNFDDESGRLMEGMVRYAVVELLRSGLKGDETSLNTASRAAGNVDAYAPNQGHMNYLLAASIQEGTSAGRSYGGCSSLDLASAERALRESGQADNPQSAYGGAGERSSEGNGECWIQTSGCYCCRLNSDGTPRRTPMTVAAVIKKNKVVYCKRSGCGAWLAPGGATKDKGRIAERAEMLASQGPVAQGEPQDMPDDSPEGATEDPIAIEHPMVQEQEEAKD